jgi:hypothetical protein
MNNLSKKSSKTIDLTRIVNAPTRISARELHKYVVSLVGVFMLFVITYPIAIHRVAQKQQFASDRSYLKSLTSAAKSIESPAGN